MTELYLRLVEAGDDARKFSELLDLVAGVAKPTSGPLIGPDFATAVGSIAAWMRRLEERLAAIEAELEPAHRSCKCPRCRQMSLTVVAARRHPEFGDEGVEQHDVRCSCGYQASRLYDPRDYLR